MLVGCLNTGITLGVIFLCKSLLGVNPYVSNALGYVAGLINSFIWNKNWVFKSQKGYSREAIKFAVGFGACFALQFVIVYTLSYHSALGTMLWHIGPIAISGYGLATLIGMVFYTVANFLYNRFVTFR
jgi:putative flippase GtrA